jgi:hypothetical protein
MADSLTYRGDPPYSQGNASSNALDRLVKMGVTDIQAPYRPDPMHPATANVGTGQYFPDTLEEKQAGDKALTAKLGLYVGGIEIDMKSASSSDSDFPSKSGYGNRRETRGL